MHLAESILHQLAVAGVMSEQGPIGAGDVASLDRLIPQHPQLARRGGLGEAPDHGAMLVVQGLVQNFRRIVALAGGLDGPNMELVIGSGGRLTIAEFDAEAPQLAGGQAGADHRAMKPGRDIPDLRALPSLAIGAHQWGQQRGGFAFAQRSGTVAPLEDCKILHRSAQSRYSLGYNAS